jgi:predicted DsbA family dithiol-disulfide isomerase
VTENYIQGIAKQMPGLKLAQWTAARNDSALANEVAGDAQVANGRGLNGTPTFLIGRSGGVSSQLEPSFYTEAGPFDEAIEKLVKS